jgi:hypothetical protein
VGGPKVVAVDKILGNCPSVSHLYIGRDGVPRPDSSRARWRKFSCVSFRQVRSWRSREVTIVRGDSDDTFV